MKNHLLIKSLTTAILLISVVLVKAQDQQPVTLNPYFDPKDKEILLNIDEHTGELKGVISLKQPWVDKAFSKDSKYIYTVSANYVTKIDLETFKIIEEKKFYEKPPKEEWDDSEKYQKSLDEIVKKTGVHTSWNDLNYTSKYKVASNGNVLFFTKSYKYLEKSKELFELKKWRDKECEPLQKGSEEWSRIYKEYNDKYAKLLPEQSKYSNWYDVKIFNYNSEESRILLSDGGNWTGKLLNDLYCSYNYTKKEIVSIDLLNGTIKYESINMDDINNNYGYTPSSVFVLKYDNLYAQFNGDKTLVAPLSSTGVIQYANALLFSDDGEYYKWANPLYYGSGNGDYIIEVVKNKLSPPIHHQSPAPDRSTMKKKEYNEAMLKWEQESAKNLKKFQKEHAEYIKKMQEVIFNVIKKGVEKPIKVVEGASRAYVFNRNKLLIDRKYELELYDLESKKTIWITELDY